MKYTFFDKALAYMREFHKRYSTNDLYGIPKECQKSIDLAFNKSSCQTDHSKTVRSGYESEVPTYSGSWRFGFWSRTIFRHWSSRVTIFFGRYAVFMLSFQVFLAVFLFNLTKEENARVNHLHVYLDTRKARIIFQRQPYKKAQVAGKIRLSLTDKMTILDSAVGHLNAMSQDDDVLMAILSQMIWSSKNLRPILTTTKAILPRILYGMWTCNFEFGVISTKPRRRVNHWMWRCAHLNRRKFVVGELARNQSHHPRLLTCMESRGLAFVIGFQVRWPLLLVFTWVFLHLRPYPSRVGTNLKFPPPNPKSPPQNSSLGEELDPNFVFCLFPTSS